MVDETNKDGTQNASQVEGSDSVTEQLSTESEPQKKELQADPSSKGPSQDR